MRRFTAFALLGMFIAIAPATAQRSSAPRTAEEDPRIERSAPATGCGFLGVYPANMSARTINRLGLGERRGAYVTGVMKETGAARAGILEKDVITAFNGELITSEAQLRRLILAQTPGAWARIDLFRNGQTMTVNAEISPRSRYFGGPDCVTPSQEPVEQHQQIEQRLRDAVKDLDLSQFDLRELDEDMLEVERELSNARNELGQSIRVFRTRRETAGGIEGNTGLGLQSISPQLAEYFRTGSTSGALVNEVTSSSPAERAGLQAGDVIVDVNGATVAGPMDAVKGIVADADGAIELRVIRDGSLRSFRVETGPGRSDGATPRNAPNLLPDIGAHSAPQREGVRRVGGMQDLQ